MDIKAHALVYSGPGQARIDEVSLPDMSPGLVEVAAECSAISRGTERLIFEGRVPKAEWTRMRAPHQVGEFPFPVRYGYASVGRVTQGPEMLQDRHVFCLFPHQTHYRVPVTSVVPVPEGVPPSRAVLAANMETALNAVWDASPRPGMKCLVVGAGLLGALITAVLSHRSDLTVDVTDKREDPVVKWADVHVNYVSPQDVTPETYDLVFHTSATAAGLQTAIDALGFEGRVIELSWYGDRQIDVRLGGNFHANRLQIISSQVGHVALSRRNALSYSDRLSLALKALRTDWVDQLITAEVPFQNLPDQLPNLLDQDAPGIATRIVY